MSSGVSNPHPRINKLFSRNNAHSARDRPTSLLIDSPVAIPTATTSTRPWSKQVTRKASNPSAHKDKEPDNSSSDQKQKSKEGDLEDDSPFEPPVIVEPPSQQSQTSLYLHRRSTDRPLSAIYSQDANIGSAPSARFSEFSSRLSGWFSHSFNLSSTDLSIPVDHYSQPPITPQLINQASSPKQKSSGILTTARHGKLEKAVRYLLDPDASPDRCSEPIWLMGVMHPGHDPRQLGSPSPSYTPHSGHRRDSTESSLAHRRSAPPSALRGGTFHSNPSLQSLSLPSNTSILASSAPRHNQPLWPAAFYEDFCSCLWMTYRSHFPPIRDVTLASLDVDIPSLRPGVVSSPPKQKWWPLGGEKTWTSDTGWGCMLRTGQSLLGTALIRLHLSRDWRRPNSPSQTEEYATYARIVSWFLDAPSPMCPFSVHRMALAGKDLGKDVGSWFGPSTAAGAIKSLVHAFPEARLSVSLAVDSVVFESDVYEASHHHQVSQSSTRKSRWGGSPVLVLVGIRLGIDGVNPVYYGGLQAIFTWPQSVGISGGRPSSSYFFVGEQAGSLFYLDPHYTRPAVPFRPFVTTTINSSDSSSGRFNPTQETKNVYGRRNNGFNPPISEGHLKFSSTDQVSSSDLTSPRERTPFFHGSPPSDASHHSQAQLSSRSFTHHSISAENSASSDEEHTLDPFIQHYSNAYAFSELRTFHCEKVRKMPFSALDPSMLLGFLCRDESDWKDLRNRLTELSRTHKPIFSIADEPPLWDSDSEELESVSEPDPEPELDQQASLDQSPDEFDLENSEGREENSSDDQVSWDTEDHFLKSGDPPQDACLNNPPGTARIQSYPADTNELSGAPATHPPTPPGLEPSKS